MAFTNVLGYLPTLQYGDKGTINGMHYIERMQIMLDYLVPETVTADGVYGNKTAEAVAKVMGGGNGHTCTVDVWNRIYGIQHTPPANARVIGRTVYQS